MEDMKDKFLEELLARYHAERLAEKNAELIRRVSLGRSTEEALASFRGLVPRTAEIRTKIAENV